LKVWPKEYKNLGGNSKIGILSSLILPVLAMLSLKLDSYDKVLNGHSSLCVVATKVRDA
jgi:hypothetical protein